MAFKDIFKISRKTFFYPSGWLGLNNIKMTTDAIYNSARGLFVVAKPGREESFDEAVQRQGLSVEDVDHLAQRYQITGYIFLAFGIAVILFSFYLLFRHGSFLSLLLGIASSALFIAQAFRYDFWHFQIVHRKLGCTLDEWWRGSINERGDA